MTQYIASTLPVPMGGEIQIPDDVRAAISKSGSLVAACDEIEVVDDDTLETVNGLRVEVQTALKNIEAQRKHMLEPANETAKRIRDFFRPFVDRLEEAKAASGNKITFYRRRKKEEAEAERAQAEAAERSKREESIAKLRVQADAEEESGHSQTAAALRDSAREIARSPSAVVSTSPVAGESRTKGTHFREQWKASVNWEEQAERLEKAIANWNARHENERLLPAQFWNISGTMLNKFAEDTKGARKLPGVRFESIEVPITRRR